MRQVRHPAHVRLLSELGAQMGVPAQEHFRRDQALFGRHHQPSGNFQSKALDLRLLCFAILAEERPLNGVSDVANSELSQECREALLGYRVAVVVAPSVPKITKGVFFSVCFIFLTRRLAPFFSTVRCAGSGNRTILQLLLSGIEAGRLRGHLFAKVASQNDGRKWQALRRRLRHLFPHRKVRRFENLYPEPIATDVLNDRFSLVYDHLIEFNQLALANAEGSDDMLNRVMTKDNIGLAALLETKEGAWSNGTR